MSDYNEIARLFAELAQRFHALGQASVQPTQASYPQGAPTPEPQVQQAPVQQAPVQQAPVQQPAPTAAGPTLEDLNRALKALSASSGGKAIPRIGEILGQYSSNGGMSGIDPSNYAAVLEAVKAEAVHYQ
jgi:hypothetical protein